MRTAHAKNKEKLEQAIELRQSGKSFAKIAKLLSLDRGTIAAWTRQIILNDEQKMLLDSANNKYQYNTELFITPNSLTYYILGVFLSDGNVNSNLEKCSISSKDEDWLENIRDFIALNKPIYKRKDSGCYVLEISSKFIVKWLIKHECVPAKSLTVKFPIIPVQYIPDLIRGIFDGDGWVTIMTRKNKKLNTKNFSSGIVSASLPFLEEIQKYLGIGSIYERKWAKPRKFRKTTIIQRNRIWNLQFCKHDTIKLMRIMYYTNNCLSLKRKEDKYKKIESILEDEEKFDRYLGDSWPNDDELIALVKNKTYVLISKQLGVTSSAIISHLQKRGIFKPNRNYE